MKNNDAPFWIDFVSAVPKVREMYADTGNVVIRVAEMPLCDSILRRFPALKGLPCYYVATIDKYGNIHDCYCVVKEDDGNAV